MRWRSTGTLNAGKCLLLFATAAAWGTGIILFNGDLPFTLINILSHGIPYMALIWLYGRNQARRDVARARLTDEEAWGRRDRIVISGYPEGTVLFLATP